jgi:hypothetical protein
VTIAEPILPKLIVCREIFIRQFTRAESILPKLIVCRELFIRQFTRSFMNTTFFAV